MSEGRVRRAYVGIAGGPRPLPPRVATELGRERGDRGGRGRARQPRRPRRAARRGPDRLGGRPRRARRRRPPAPDGRRPHRPARWTSAWCASGARMTLPITPVELRDPAGVERRPGPGVGSAHGSAGARRGARTPSARRSTRRRRGSGRVVLVAGEAGIGKSSLLAAVPGGARRATRRFLVGRLRPAPDAAGPRARSTTSRARPAGAWPTRCAATAAARTSWRPCSTRSPSSPPRVLVVEDVHWADEGTLDLLALLGRRIGTTTGTLMVTLRPDQAGDRLRGDARRAAGGGGAARRPAARSARRRWPSSPAAPGAPAAGPPPDHRAATPSTSPRSWPRPGDEIPGSVRDAVLARARRLSPAAREVLEIVVRGARARRDVARQGGARGRPGRAGGRVRGGGDARARRGRPALPPRDRPLQRRGGAVADAPPRARRARARRPARARRRRPGAPGAPRAARGRRTRPCSPPRPPPRPPRPPRARTPRRPSTTARRSTPRGTRRRSSAPSCWRASRSRPTSPGGPDEALATRREALAIRTDLGQIAEAGEDERWLSRLLWWAGQRVESEAAANRAVALLEPLGPSPGLAMAYSTLSQLDDARLAHPGDGPVGQPGDRDGARARRPRRRWPTPSTTSAPR